MSSHINRWVNQDVFDITRSSLSLGSGTRVTLFPVTYLLAAGAPGSDSEWCSQRT